MKTMEIGAFEAKTKLSALLEKVRNGQTYFITKRGQPVAELRPVSTRNRCLKFGCDRHRVVIGADFDAPIPELKGYME